MNECDVIKCCTAVELLARLSAREVPFASSHRRDWVFRGQGDSDWDLRPAAFRNADRLLSPVGDVPWSEWHNGLQMVAEADTLHSFVIEADQAGLPLPGDLADIRTKLHEPHHSESILRERFDFVWPSRTVWPVVALAQHYGIATRFLDWTRSPLIACYFAAVDVIKYERVSDFAIWAFSTALTDYAAGRRRSNSKRVVVATAPYASNPNLRAQRGIHIALSIQNPDMAARADRDDIGDFLAEIDWHTRPKGHPALLKFVLPASSAPHLLWHLAKEGVTAAELFPGYRGAATAVLQSRWHTQSAESGT